MRKAPEGMSKLTDEVKAIKVANSDILDYIGTLRIKEREVII